MYANTPAPPYYAVIFTNQRTDGDHGYEETANRMVELALQQPGCLGAESTRNTEGFGITVSYWTDETAIAAWKAQTEHQLAQKMGREKWYASFRLRVAKVERDYGF